MDLKPRYSSAYLNGLFESDEYEDLVQISSLICACEQFSPAAPNYRLPTSLFVFVEGLLWSAQSIRSGTWTYYEATPALRQHAMHRALEELGALEVAQQYAEGMEHWRDEARMQSVDRWLQDHEADNARWLWELARANRSSVEELLR
jgi:hypothetical protein